MPEANEMVVGIMAVVAQAERKMTSARTKAALAAAKARGVVLGGRREGTPDLRPYAKQASAASAVARAAKAAARAEDLAPVIEEMRAAGAVSLRGMARELNARGIPAPHGGKWSAMAVARVVARVEAE